MNSLNFMRHLGRTWYMMVGLLCCFLVGSGSAESTANEIHGFSTQRRLAEHSRLMYGLEGQAAAKPHWKKSRSARGKQSFQSKKRGQPDPVVGNARTLGKKSLQAKQGTSLQPLKGQRGNRKQWGRHRQKRSTQYSKHSRSGRGAHATAGERRMGTFIGPVNGSAVNRSSGLFFRVPENAEVRASSRGQVVYAGWFRGYGLLTIVNHGGRVYSLYGHNRDLLVAKGDAVEPGQVIAKSGRTGSVDGVPGLYFEIRRGNRPENPRRWLARDRAHSDKLASLMQ
ncbi:MAG: peptidoglycan DD-metalloendopeptidase family protein [Magnetococcales bacterium]|nr:peptidoglycan DD-metalloendopeptidase family protein [Magnetococcales bacterium]MBF0113561.1 peptidoglycan DD-metalloendopeptidase family protein [Magnetococcales bacterium]